MNKFFRLIRIEQWVKNGFVFTPLIFAGLTGSAQAITSSVLAFFYFSVAASAVYILNDVMDLEYDRAHPAKSRSRPLACGEIGMATALGLMAVLFLAALSSFFWNPKVAIALCAYMAINVAYSTYLKKVPVVDIFTVAAGYPFRVYAGALAVGVPLSQWMFVTVFALALFLASTKRMRELKDQPGLETRPVLREYSLRTVEQFVQISAMAALVFYCLFVLTARGELVITVPLVLFGFFRYLLITDQAECGESPTETLLSDWPMLVTVVSWAILSIVLLGS